MEGHEQTDVPHGSLRPGELTTIVAEHFPVASGHVLEALKVVYANDAIARRRNLSPSARLAFHQAQSGPTMEGLKTWLTR